MSSLLTTWTTSLHNVASSEIDGVARVYGPRRWWGGPLDVEGLALGSARVAATAVSELTGRTMDITAERVAASFASINHLKVNGRRPERFAPMSGFHSTADGWIRLHANYPHHAKAYKDALGVTTDRAFAAQLATSRAKDIEAYIIAAGGVAAAMRSHQEWLTTPMAGASTSGPWINFMNAPTRHSATASIWRPPDDHSDAPLRDLRVLDFTRVIAGPSASRLLAALGADVLRVDSPNNPELLDQYIDTGFCKRSAELNLNEPAGLAKVRELLEECHVVLLGYRTGSLDKFGLTPEMLTDAFPTLKIVRFNAWGWSGPWHRTRGFDSIVQAATGIADIYRNTDGSPGKLPVQALDHATGMGVVAAVAMLLATEHLSWAQMSLARTAHELMCLPVTQRLEAALEVPLRQFQTSPYGSLEHVPPPLLLDGEGVEYAQPPVAYGSSPALWKD